MKKFASNQHTIDKGIMNSISQGVNQQAILALGWVIDSLQEALQEAYVLVDQHPSIQNIRDANVFLHQVSGTLTITELPDPLILATSLEQLADAIVSQQIEIIQARILAEGIKTLQQELLYLHVNKRLQPIAIYRMVKIVRQKLEEKKLNTDQAYPAIDYSLLVDANQVDTVLDESQWKAVVQIYRHLINEFLLNTKDQETLENLHKVAQHFATGASNIQQAALWNILSKLHQAMAEQQVDLDSLAIKQALIHLERMLAQDIYDEHVLFELLEIFDIFQLKHNYAIHQQALIAALGEDHITSPLVLDKIVAMLQNVKTSLQQPTGQVTNGEARRLLEEAVHLLELTGWQDISDELKEIQSDFGFGSHTILPTDAIERINHIEVRLNQLVTAFEHQSSDFQEFDSHDIVFDAKNAAIRESRVALETIKTIFFNYVSSRHDKALLDDFTDQFKALNGAFIVLNLHRAAQLVERFIAVLDKTILDPDYVPNRHQLDLIAENIISLEYYLDHLAAHFHDEQMLVKFEIASDKLTHEAPEEINQPLAGGEKLYHDQTPIEVLSSLEDSTVTKQPVHALETETETEHTQVINSVPHRAINELQLLTDDFSQDEDIREIFVEEATEVLETLAEKFPIWSANVNDIETLKEVRRAFHTLKGSGRMVGGFVSGELAWSVENMLNRVLDNTIAADALVLQLIQQVLDIYPQMIADYAQGKTTSVETRPLMFVANALSRSETLANEDLPWLSAPVSAPAQQPEIALEAVKTQDADNPVADNAIANLDISEDEKEGVSIFVEEAEEHLDTLHQFIASPELHAEEVPDDVIRALHTLRGSAAMSKVDSVYQLASSLEDEFKRLLRMHQPVSYEHVGFLEQFVQCVGTHLEALEAGKYAELDSCDRDLIEQIEALAPPQAGDEDTNESAAETAQQAGIVAQLLDLSLNELLDAEYELEAKLASNDANEYLGVLSDQSQQLHAAALKTPITALQQLMQYLTNVYHKLKNVNADLIGDDQVDSLLNAHFALTNIFDSLAASQKPVLDIKVIDALSDILATDFAVSEIAKQPDIQQPIDEIIVSPALVTFDSTPLPASTSVQPVIESDRKIDSQVDTELLEIFMEEAEELVNEIDQQFGEWQREPQNIQPLIVLQRHLHTLKGGARMAQVASLGDFGHELETVYERLVNGNLQSTPALIQFMRHAQDIVAEQVDQLGKNQTSFFAEPEYAALLSYLERGNDQILADFNAQGGYKVAQNTSTAVSKVPDLAQGIFDTADLVAKPVIETEKSINTKPANLDNLNTLAEQGEISSSKKAPAVSSQSKAATPVAPKPTDKPIEQQNNYINAREWTAALRPDADMLSIFIEEAQEQAEHSYKLLQRWLKDNKDKRALLELQRSLHTLKGSARMAGVTSMAKLAHELEFIYEELANTSFKGIPTVAVELLHICHDWLIDALDVLKQDKEPIEPDTLILALQRFRKDPDALVSLPRADQSAQSLVEQNALTLFEQEEVQETKGDGTEPPSMYGLFAGTNQNDQAASNEMIRVSASTIEKMINLAGENAINRARIEMGVNSIGFVLDDMGLTIQRLAEQLRRMEGELESQILARHEQERGQYADFDPLEMDQYSALNQLSKSLAESASDLVDFKITLSDKIRDTENLLLQQSRIQSELQDGLMNSRLVPFSRLLPRLQRVVRQTSTELSKPAELIVNNAEGELDRTVLDRMVAPLEHMLRNAVDHGLETPEQREAANKPAQGQIRLNVERQGNEIIITLDDDGKGINVEAVRGKAVERGLIAADSKLSDYDIMQFIFHAGLSTAEKVTQISGRGVGMDVVQNEIKLLGGTVSVSSEIGKGTRITMRLPLTVAVADALMVRVGDRQFAIPLAQIERIVRVSPVALEQYYHSKNENFKIDKQQYRLRYLGEFIHGNKTPHLHTQGMSLPVLLIKSMGQPTAIQVDQLVGSRAEIVVKPAGQQLTSIDMISGATILGDGSVTIILDALALARRAAASKRTQAAEVQKASASREAGKKHLVMVVDDSVTVRKVTTRLLERQGYEVVTAKDGVDAIEKLEEVTPDIMLLDIEMPRMDGFEVATLVRHNEAISELPIIMITSRTGEKHRERAFLTGVNCYMGKPFQEAELLQNIEEILSNHPAANRIAE